MPESLAQMHHGGNKDAFHPYLPTTVVGTPRYNPKEQKGVQMKTSEGLAQPEMACALESIRGIITVSTYAVIAGQPCHDNAAWNLLLQTFCCWAAWQLQEGSQAPKTMQMPTAPPHTQRKEIYTIVNHKVVWKQSQRIARNRMVKGTVIACWNQPSYHMYLMCNPVSDFGGQITGW